LHRFIGAVVGDARQIVDHHQPSARDSLACGQSQSINADRRFGRKGEAIGRLISLRAVAFEAWRELDLGIRNRVPDRRWAGEIGPEQRDVGRLADADGGYASAEGLQRGWQQRQQPQDGGALERLDHHHQGLEGLGGGLGAEAGQWEGALRPVAETGELGGLADRCCEGLEGRNPRSMGRKCSSIKRDGESKFGGLEHAFGGQLSQPFGRTQGRDGQRPDRADLARGTGRPGPTNGFWRDADWLYCRDERWRPVEPGTFPLVDGSAFRVDSGSPYAGKSRQGVLKGYGNAVDAQATIDFIKVCREYRADRHVAPGGVDGLLV
jgi:hypothetical protein